MICQAYCGLSRTIPAVRASGSLIKAEVVGNAQVFSVKTPHAKIKSPSLIPKAPKARRHATFGAFKAERMGFEPKKTLK